MVSISSEQGTGQPLPSEAQKYILWGLDSETYGLPITQAREILADFETTSLPNLPRFVHGVISVRGQAIPVIDLRRRFELQPKPRDRQTRVIIVELGEHQVGIQVDQVFRVASIDAASVQQQPAMTGGQRSPFVSGVAVNDAGKFSILLDLQKILTSVEQVALADMAAAIRGELEQKSAAELASGTERSVGDRTAQAGVDDAPKPKRHGRRRVKAQEAASEQTPDEMP